MEDVILFILSGDILHGASNTAMHNWECIFLRGGGEGEGSLSITQLLEDRQFSNLFLYAQLKQHTTASCPTPLINKWKEVI